MPSIHKQKANLENMLPQTESENKTQKWNAITSLYNELSQEFERLSKTDYPKSKIGGYEDALWDFRIVANEKFSMDLPKIEKQTSDNMLCNCGHPHKEHLSTTSINYTAGRCTKCTCKNFIMPRPER